MNQSDSAKQHFGIKFRAWRQSQGISAYRIAKLTGIHPSFISNVEAARRPMSETFMRKIADIPELPISYETLRAWKLESEYQVDELKQALDSVNAAAANSDLTALDGLYRIPLKMTVSAGGFQPKDAMEEPVYIDWYGLKSLSTDLFCLKVQGDSMWPPIPNGAILLVREADQFKNGEKYVIETADDQMTFKLMQYDKNGAKLMPLNPAYPAMPLTKINIKALYQVLSYKVDWT